MASAKMESTRPTLTVSKIALHMYKDTNALDRPLVGTHSGRWRMAQVLMISIFGQFSGNGLGYFNTVIFGQLGVTTSSAQLGYNLLNSVLSAIGALSAVALTDRMPRRKVLVFGTFGKRCISCGDFQSPFANVFLHSLRGNARHKLWAIGCN